MRIALAAIILSATALAAVPAAAQEVEGDLPYSGIYVGGSVGLGTLPNNGGQSVLFDRNLDGGFNDTVVTMAGVNAFAPGTASGFCPGAPRGNAAALGCDNNVDDSDIEYYARVGIDHQMGNIVIGAVGEFGRPEFTDFVTAFSNTPASYTFSREIDYNASIRGRLGYATDGATLFYGTFGASYAKIDNGFATSNGMNSFTANDDKDDAWGITAGGGVEQRVGAFSFGLEYIYTQYKQDDYRIRVGRGTAAATNPFVLAPNTTGTDFRRSDDKFNFSSFRFTAGFHF